MFARVKFLPNAFSRTPGDVQASVLADLEWMREAAPFRNSAMYQNQFAFVSDRIRNNVDMLTPHELYRMQQQDATLQPYVNEIR